MNTNALDELKQAQAESKASQNRLDCAQIEAARLMDSIKKKLPVGENIQIKLGALPNGRIAVHSWMGESKGSALTIVEPDGMVDLTSASD